ncbi:MAG: hypothetical protein PHX39_05395 [Bacteroidales bacterium]|nr:hypothetical protein [Bacteroidales bacterium]
MKTDTTLKHKQLVKLWDQFNARAQEHLFLFYHQKINDLSQLISSYRQEYKNLQEAVAKTDEKIGCLRHFTAEIFKLLMEHQQRMFSIDTTKITEVYWQELEAQLKAMPRTLQPREIFTPYHIRRTDTPAIWWRKVRINSRFKVKQILKKTINPLRRLFKMNPYDLVTWRVRKVPFRLMATHYLHTRLAEMLAPVTWQFMQDLNKVLMQLWIFDNKTDETIQQLLTQNKLSEKLAETLGSEEADALIEKLQEELRQIEIKYQEEIQQQFAAAATKLDKALPIADTPDLSLRRLNPRRLETERQLVIQKFDTGLHRWENTHRTLFDDWAIDVEIVLLYYHVLSQLEVLRGQIDTYIEDTLTPDFEKLRSFLNTSASRLKQDTGTLDELLESLKKERRKLNRELIDTLLAKTIEVLSVGFTDDILQFENKTLAATDEVTEKRSFVKNMSYEKGVRDSEINYISPRELLHFESLPHFRKAIQDVNGQVRGMLENARLKLLAMGTVADFSLESAMMLPDQKQVTADKVLEVAIEGYARAEDHLNQTIALIESIYDVPLTNLRQAVHVFNTQIQELKNTDNILDLNLRIARIKAVNQSKKARQDALKWLRNIAPKAANMLRSRFSDTYALVMKLRYRIGFAPPRKHISYELTEFISQSQQSLDKLPFVYQRLYQLRPTDEDRFFVNRLAELDQMKLAFDDWQKERYVTVAVLGEKGSGITSFINYYLRDAAPSLKIIHQEPKIRISLVHDYLRFFEDILGVEKFEDNRQIIEYLNSRNDKLIVILENMQRFYLKKINGFECLKMFFELMMQTSRKVFWITSFTVHAWDYLDLTVRISDQFVREVQLAQLDEAIIMNIILKRNSLSGYKISFEPSDENIVSRSFKNLKEDEKQSFLEKQYFKDLRQLSNGNISLAQLYWLRSIHSITDNTITIASIREIDVSFVKELPSNYLFILHALLVHDGLSTEAYGDIFHMSATQAQNLLQPLLEKGLLMQNGDVYTINPIIFRQVVNLLKSRNFIN